MLGAELYDLCYHYIHINTHHHRNHHYFAFFIIFFCQGVRCDGIHFGSDYWPEFAWDLKDASSSSDGGVRNGGKETKVTQYRCHSSEGIWDYPLASFLAQASQEWKEKGR